MRRTTSGINRGYCTQLLGQSGVGQLQVQAEVLEDDKAKVLAEVEAKVLEDDKAELGERGQAAKPGAGQLQEQG